MQKQEGICNFCDLDVTDNSTIAITLIIIIEMYQMECLENQTFYLFQAGLTNLLGLNPFRRPAPNPLILLLPKAPTVSVLPVRTLPFPILNYRQLSLLRPSLRLGPRHGDSFNGEILSAAYYPSYSLILSYQTIAYYYSLKQGWFRACSAVILSSGLILSIFLKRSMANSSVFSYSPESKSKLHVLFSFSISLYVLPLKRLLPKTKRWNISPRLKMSHTGAYFVFISLMLMTQGATQPGVPHLTNKYSSESANSASPQSAITHSQLSRLLSKIFQGFKSLCIMFLECISFSPSSMLCTINFILVGLNFSLDCINQLLP